MQRSHYHIPKTVYKRTAQEQEELDAMGQAAAESIARLDEE